MKDRICKNCEKTLKENQKKFCSPICYRKGEQDRRVSEWLTGKLSGHSNSKNNDIRPFVRKYLLEKYNFMCVKCGFSGTNKKSGKSILQVNHIDGNSENSRPENLELICLNCHAMTENFMGLNRGKSTRKNRYLET